MKPKALRRIPIGRGYKTGVDGYTGISVYLTTVSTAKNNITEYAEVNNPTAHNTQTISEIVEVTIE